jgi:hypothetical protein
VTITEAPGALRESLRSKDRDGNRWYEYPPTGEQFISVTAVLGATEGKPWLVPWSAKRAAARCVDQLPLIAEMLADKGRDETLAYLAKDAEQDRDLKADTGTYVHDVVEALILWAASPEGTGRDIILPDLPDHLIGADYDGQPVEDVTEWMVNGFLNFVSDWKPRFEAAEMPVFHIALRAAGTLDLIVTIFGYAIDFERNILVPCPGAVLVICLDVKTGKHQSVTWREQVAVYRRAEECIPDPTSGMHPMPHTDCSAVLHLRPEYAKGYRVMLVSGADDEAAWGTFQHALITFHDRTAAKAKPGKVVYPIGPDGKIPAPLLADLDGEGYGRMLSPLMKAGIESLGQLAEMTAAECTALKGVGPKTVDNARGLLAEYGLCLAGEQLTAVA